MSQMLDNALVHTFPSADVINLTCTGFGPANMSQIRITAVQVGRIVTN